MKSHSLIVDGMLSGTGIRDAIEGGYLEPKEIGISSTLTQRIMTWLSRYEDAHYHQYTDKSNSEALDLEGIEIAKLIRTELPAATVRYFSNANMQEIKF